MRELPGGRGWERKGRSFGWESGENLLHGVSGGSAAFRVGNRVAVKTTPPLASIYTELASSQKAFTCVTWFDLI